MKNFRENEDFVPNPKVKCILHTLHKNGGFIRKVNQVDVFLILLLQLSSYF